MIAGIEDPTNTERDQSWMYTPMPRLKFYVSGCPRDRIVIFVLLIVDSKKLLYDHNKEEQMNRFIGNWKITEMGQWDQYYIDLIEPGYFGFDRDGMGEFVFGTVNGFMDCRYDNNKDAKRVEFSWDGTCEHDPVCGRGWFEVKATDQIYGELFIHNGDESWVKAVKR